MARDSGLVASLRISHGARIATLSLCAALLTVSILAQAEEPRIFYVYDALNRLIAVIDQQGNIGSYTYDSASNLLRVDRFDATAIPGPLGITLVSPGRGKVGTTVAIFGKGFGASPAGVSAAFNGTPAAVASVAPNRIVTAVPSGATTGSITVTVPLGTATSPTAFVVLGALAVSPTSATLLVQASQQFQATEAGAPTTNVLWAVNGIPGGDTSVGTITVDGLYTAPAVVPAPDTVTVSALHKDDRSIPASASVKVVAPPPVFLTARAVSVAVAEPPAVADKSVTAAVSVELAQVATPTVVSAPVSVRFAEPGTTFATAPQTAVALEPVITGVAPTTGAPGATFTITLSGAGFSGATGLAFLLNNASDGAITVASLAVNPAGTQATAAVTIAAGAALGARVIQIITPAGSSTPTGTGGANLFTVE